MERGRLKRFLLFVPVVLLMLVGVYGIYAAADNNKSVEVTDIDYEDLTMTIKSQNGDNRILFAKKRNATTWDVIPTVSGGITTGSVTMDISWASVSRINTLYLKGDKSEEPVEVKLPKQNNKFKAKFNPADYSVTFSNMDKAAENDVYWRKAKSTTWQKYDAAKMKDLVETFCTKGITLYFRTGQVRGKSAAEVGARPSKATTMKITKRASAPKVKLDYKKMLFTKVKSTMEYRAAGGSEWKPIASTTLKLGDALPEVLYNASDSGSENGDATQTYDIEFRVKATTSKLASCICTLTVPKQKAIDVSGNGLAFNYTGSQQCKIKVDKASSKTPYEYIVVEGEGTPDIYSTSWKAITTQETLISSSTAPAGSHIWLRKKATSDELPSYYVDVAGGPLSYPKFDELYDIVIADPTITRIQGVESTPVNFVVYASEMDVDVDSITCSGSTTKVKYTQGEKITEPGDNGKTRYGINVTIDDTSDLEKREENLNKDLPLVIALTNGDKITGKVTLYIAKAATIAEAEYTKYVGLDSADIKFDVKLNDKNKKGPADSEVEVDSIWYNRDDLDKRSDYTVTQKSGTDDTLSVSIPDSTLNKISNPGGGYLLKSQYGTAYSFAVKLTNGEVLDQVKLKVEYPVTISLSDNAPTFISSSAYTTGSSTATPTIQDPVVTCTLKEGAIEAGETYTLTSATWNGEDIRNDSSSRDNVHHFTVGLKKIMDCYSNKKEPDGYIVLTFESDNDSNKKIEVKDYGYFISVGA